MRALRIGITGKLGSGKSLLVRYLERRGFFCIRSDELARELMERDPALRKQLIQILGPNTYANNTLNRAFVASKIFSDHALRMRVENAVHPATTGEVERVFGAHSGETVVVESALILQTQFCERFDYIVLVEATDEVAIERVVKEGRLSRADAEQRLAEQGNDPIDRAEADIILDNSGSIEAFETRCKLLIDIIESLAPIPLPEKPLHE